MQSKVGICNEFISLEVVKNYVITRRKFRPQKRCVSYFELTSL